MCCRFCLSIAAFAFFGVYPWFPCWQRTYPANHVTMLELATIGSKLVQSTATHDWQTEAGYHDIPFQNMPQTPKRYWSHQDLYWIPNMPVALHFFNVWPRTFHSCLLAGRRSLTMPQSRHRRTKQNMLVQIDRYVFKYGSCWCNTIGKLRVKGISLLATPSKTAGGWANHETDDVLIHWLLISNHILLGMV